MTTASIIVPSYRGARRLPTLFDSLAAQKSGTPDFEVIVVIDGVDDGSVRLVERETRFPVRHILFPENRGRVAALNTGYDAAEGDVLIRCDDDLLVPSGYVSAHVDAHRTAAQPIGVIGATRDIHDGSAYARAYGERAAADSYRFATTRPAGERWRLWAANCSITRATWENVGPYSSEYRAYGWEDVDYGYRLHAAGIPLEVVPAAEAEHHGPARSARARALKAFDSGAARATFHRLHPEAPLAQPSAGDGAWGAVVGGLARTLTSSGRVRSIGSVVDRAVELAPAPVGRKLAAALIEAGGIAGAREGATKAGASDAEASDAVASVARPRIAIAHDYLTQRGGAERLVLSIVKAFPEAQLHTLFYEPDQTYPEYRDADIRVSPLNRIGVLRRDPRKALPLLAPFSSRMHIDADVVVASSSGWAHAFPTSGKKIVYCHSPARWLYLPEDYLGEAGRFDVKRLALTVLTPILKPWDRRAAHRADRYFGNSSVVVERIRRVYGIDADPLFPPFSPAVADGEQEPIPGAGEGGHYLVVSRLQPYKHVDRVIEAFCSMPDKRLLVIGKGPEKQRLQAMAPENVQLVEGLSDAQMRWAYAHCTALIAASHEDFGLTPLEAGAHGKPVVALHAGGYLDTIREGVNGVFFEAPQAAQIAAGVRDLEARGPWDPQVVREHVEAFSEQRFIAALREAVERATRGGTSA